MSAASTAGRPVSPLAILRDSPEPFELPNHPDQQGSDHQRCEHTCISIAQPLHRIVCCECGAIWHSVPTSSELPDQRQLYVRLQRGKPLLVHTEPAAPQASERKTELPKSPYRYPGYDKDVEEYGVCGACVEHPGYLDIRRYVGCNHVRH